MTAHNELIPTATIPHFSGLASAFWAAFCWGTATVMSKGALREFAPVTLLCIQLTSSVIFLWAIVLWRKQPKVGRNNIMKFAWLGLLEPGLAYFLGLWGLEKTEASIATLIQSSEAMMIIVVSVLILRERPTRRMILLSLFSFSGLVLAVCSSNVPVTLGYFAGNLLIFLGTLVAAFYAVLVSRAANHGDAFYIIAWQQTVALIFALSLMGIQAAGTNALRLPEQLDYSLLALAVCSGIVQYAFAFVFNITALRTLSANIAGSFLSLVPLFGMVGGYLFLNEVPTIIQLIGVGITLISVVSISLMGHRNRSLES